MADTVDYTDLINKRIQDAVLNNYKKTQAFTTACAALFTSLGLTVDNFNTYLNAAVAAGISPEAAMDCYTLTLSMKS